MTGQIVIQSDLESANRHQPLLPPYATPPPPRDMKANVGECAGSAAAECASICCCCPYVVAEFLVIAVYKLPTALCRRIWRKRCLRKKLKNMKMMSSHRDSGRMSTIHCFEDDYSSEADLTYFEAVKVSIDGSAEVVDLDREMWDRFRNSGFGRSLSQRHDL